MLYKLFVAAIFLVSTSMGQEEKEEVEDVVTLTFENFNSVITDNDRVLVEFYAPWCGHCKALAPEYEKAAAALKEQGSKTILAKVDATEETELASKYEVRGYPTLKYFTKDVNNPIDYTGGRSEETIVAWLTKREKPAVTELQDEDAITEFTKENDIVLLAYVSEKDDVAVISKIAEVFRESVSVVLKKDTSRLIKLVRHFDTPEVEFTGEFDESAIIQFIQSERFPLFAEISQNNYREYVERDLGFVWVAVDPSDKDMFERVSEGIKASTEAFKGELSFVWIDNTKYNSHIKNLGISDVPGLIIITNNDSKFLFTGDVTDSNAVNDFFAKYKAGTLDTFLKSQEPPESNDGNVFVLVGKTFSDVVGKDKDVFVEFYAPWCGHCKRLAPEYEKVGQAFANVENMVIAKVDVTENDTPEDIRGFPTLIFYEAGSSDGKKYNEGRTAADMINFLKKSATVDISAVAESALKEAGDDEEEEKEEL